jgi:hypothetical protein
MTEDERSNRNPAIEVAPFDPSAHPVVRAAELERFHVYILESARYASTWNYIGVVHTLHPVTLDAVPAYHFEGPRADLNVFLLSMPDGSFSDLAGTRIVIRRYIGEDA